MTFGLFGAFLCACGIAAKFLTTVGLIAVRNELSSGFVILGVVSFMMGLFASVVFKRQNFAEKDLRHYISELNKNKEQKG